MRTQLALLFLFICSVCLGQYENLIPDFPDSTWRFTHSDTLVYSNEITIRYYDSLAPEHPNFSRFFVGQDELDKQNHFIRKQRIFPNGFSYAIDYFEGKPTMAGYANGTHSTHIQWFENGKLQSVTNFLLNDSPEGGVREGLTIWFDENGKLKGYEIYCNDVPIMKFNPEN